MRRGREAVPAVPVAHQTVGQVTAQGVVAAARQAAPLATVRTAKSNLLTHRKARRMADVWVTVTLNDKDTSETLGSKEFKVNMAEADHAQWFANPIAWAVLQILPRAEGLHISAQEAAVAARRADYEQRQAQLEEEPLAEGEGAQQGEAITP
jgi:hypothetical protein